MPRRRMTVPEQKQSKFASLGSDSELKKEFSSESKDVSSYVTPAIGSQVSGRMQYCAVSIDVRDWGPTARSFELPMNA